MNEKTESSAPDNLAAKVSGGCVAIGCGLPLVLVVFGLLWGALFGVGEPKVEVLAARVVPFTNVATGQRVGMIMVDWKNVGTGPACVVYADVAAYDAAGNVVESVNTIIHTDSEGVAPGQTYLEVGDDGYVIGPNPDTGPAVRATASITKVKNNFELQ